MRDLVERATSGDSASDPTPKVTRFTYTPRGQKLGETKANNNTVDHTYFLDGLLKTQVEKKANGTLVSSHTIAYDPNGHRRSDAVKKQNADNHAAYLDHVYAYTYDPRDRIRQVTKSAAGGGVLETESYTHDANNNVIEQTVDNVTTNFEYDRNRLLSATTGGTTAAYNYDPFGRLDKVTSGATVLERYLYDGFDRVTEHRKTNGQGGTDTTRYAYDPLDRTASRTANAGAAGEKRTDFNYLGLSGEVLSEEIAGQIQVAYQYSPWGQRLSQVKFKADGSQEDSFYGYNPHSDVETLTDQSGDTRATYGYTAYGKDDTQSFTGIDKPDPQNPTREPYNVYRFNAKRFDPASGDYDMGFRDYDPGLNRFLSRDLYNGALADLDLGLNPWTANRYAFAGGNPISFIELDGHRLPDEDLRELRKAGYTYVMGKGVVPVPGGASGGVSKGLAPPPVLIPLPPGRVPPIAGARGGLGILGLLLGVLSLSGDTPRPQKLDVDPEERKGGCLSQPAEGPSWTQYWKLDSEGRAQGAEACLGRDAETRSGLWPDEETGQPTPRGFRSGVHHRTHLIADSLGGYNIIENIVPLNVGRNLSDMARYENEVKRRTRAGERVYYFVRPVYRQHLPPAGLEVYIYSTKSRPIVGAWVPNFPPDAQSSLFNEMG